MSMIYEVVKFCYRLCKLQMYFVRKLVRDRPWAAITSSFNGVPKATLEI